MANTYVIAWKSKSEPRWGQGKKLFTREEAEALVEELNEEYPAFVHEPFDLAAGAAVSPVAQAPETSVIEVDFEPVAEKVCGVCEPLPQLVEDLEREAALA